MVVIHQEEVVEVAAHFLGGGHGGIEVKLVPLREGRENTGQHIRLNLGGHVQLGADALLFSGDPGQVVQVFHNAGLQRFDFPVQIADFILGVDGQVDHVFFRVAVFAFGKLHCGPGQHGQRFGGNFAHDQDEAQAEHRHQRHGANHHVHQELIAFVHHVVHVDVHAQDGPGLALRIQHRFIGGAEPSVFRGGHRGLNAHVFLIPAKFNRRYFNAANIEHILVGINQIHALAALQGLEINELGPQLFLVQRQCFADLHKAVIQSFLHEPGNNDRFILCFHRGAANLLKFIAADLFPQTARVIPVHERGHGGGSLGGGLFKVTIHPLAVHIISNRGQPCSQHEGDCQDQRVCF